MLWRSTFLLATTTASANNISSGTATFCFHGGCRTAFGSRSLNRRGWTAPSSSLRTRIATVASSASASMTSFSSSSSSSSEETKKRNIGRVALLQFPVTESKEENLRVAAKYLEEAAVVHKAQMVVLPEIWNSPYATAAFPEYAEALPGVGDNYDHDSVTKSPSARLLTEAARKHGMVVVGGSVPERVDIKSDSTSEMETQTRYYNTCLCVDGTGRVVAVHRKAHLFDIDVPGKITFRESDTLSPGTSLTSFDAGEPFGTIGIGICYDIRFPELAQCLVKRGCRILIYPGAFNLTTGPAHWELLQRARAVDGQCFVLTASPARTTLPDNDSTTGKYPHYVAWGHSTAVSPWGDVLETCGHEETTVVVDLDMDLVDSTRRNIPTSTQKRHDLYSLTDTMVETTEVGKTQ